MPARGGGDHANGPGRRAVAVDGQVVGTTRFVSASEAKTWHDYTGPSARSAGGAVGLDPGVEGPHALADAALVLLALLGYHRETAIRALFGMAA